MRDARVWTNAALFGALWGGAEVTLGLLLKSAGVPFFGVILGSIAVVVMVTARRLHPQPGSTLVMGLVVAFLKVFSAGGLVIGSLLGILIQATIMEVALTLAGSTAPGAVAGGALALASAPAQQFAWILLISGPRAAQALERAVVRAGALLGLGERPVWGLLAIPVIVAGLVGAAVGVLAWRIAGRVRRRLQGAA